MITEMRHNKAIGQSLDKQAEAAAMGPDPAMVAEYHERMKHYVPAKTDETFTVTLPVRFADYVHRAAEWFSAKRRIKVTPEKAIELMIREHWRMDEDRLLLTAGATGPRQDFHPASGQFSRS